MLNQLKGFLKDRPSFWNHCGLRLILSFSAHSASHYIHTHAHTDHPRSVLSNLVFDVIGEEVAPTVQRVKPLIWDVNRWQFCSTASLIRTTVLSGATLTITLISAQQQKLEMFSLCRPGCYCHGLYTGTADETWHGKCSRSREVKLPTTLRWDRWKLV